MLEHYLDQLGDMLHLCADTDGILIVNKQGVIEYHSMPMPAYYTHEDTVGKHILDIYPKQNNQTTTSNFPCNFNFTVSNMNRFNQGIDHG